MGSLTEIALSNVSKTYNPGLFKRKVRAVSNLSLEVARGEVFGLIGPNGAGKSTTIRMLLGLVRPDQGDILFRGRPIADSGLQRQVGYLPENPYLYDHLTLLELLDFCARTSGLASDFAKARMDLLLHKLKLMDASRRPLRSFSKGMLQRAGICFALLHDPAVVVFDEPMSGLDPLGRQLVFDIVSELKEHGKTVFFCSHILSDVERLCDRIGVLAAGQLIRVFERAQFREDRDQPLHLLLPQLNSAQREILLPLVGGMTERRDGTLISTSGVRLTEVGRRLDALGIPILATRGERVSLEELFLQALEEHTP